MFSNPALFQANMAMCFTHAKFIWESPTIKPCAKGQLPLTYNNRKSISYNIFFFIFFFCLKTAPQRYSMDAHELWLLSITFYGSCFRLNHVFQVLINLTALST